MLLNQIQDFIEYCNTFYGIGGLYPLFAQNGKGRQRAQTRQIRQAVEAYIYKLMTNENPHMEWGDGDSLDRERVRYILSEMGYEEKA